MFHIFIHRVFFNLNLYKKKSHMISPNKRAIEIQNDMSKIYD